MTKTIRITVWNEFHHEQNMQAAKDLYPQGMHSVIADFLNRQADFLARTATLDQPGHGLTDEVLSQTDVLIWWGHMAHHLVSDEIVDKVWQRVMDGMGFIGLHSAHFSKIFRKLMGTSCDLRWREIGEKERVWVVEPGHPIADGLPPYFEIPHAEMYGERFDIPAPDTLVFLSWFAGGDVFRSGCCYNRGKGKIFYFRPGHETYPIFYQSEIQKVIGNAVRWCAPADGPDVKFGHIPEPLEKV